MITTPTRGYIDFVVATDIHQRSQTSYTTPCNGVVSHGAQFGGLRGFADHTRKNEHTHKNAFTIFAPAALCSCLSSCSDRVTCRQIYASDGIKMVRVLVSLVYICGSGLNDRLELL